MKRRAPKTSPKSVSKSAMPLRRIPSSVFRADLVAILKAVGDGRERIIIERRGKPPVALVSADDFLQFQMLEQLRRKAAASEKTKK